MASAALLIEGAEVMKGILITIVSMLVVLAAAAALIIGTGAYNVAADEPHTAVVFGVLEAARERSIAVRADGIEVPPLDDAAMLRRGAGNYDAMCVSCHLAPGKAASELSAGLYPTPPDLTKHTHLEPAAAFWVIKHGIKSTGMPAWGKSMKDSHIWDLVAFVRKLPSLSAEQYAAEVEASEGHSHGDDETGGHSHEEGEQRDQSHEATEAERAAGRDDAQRGREENSDTPVATVKALHGAMSGGDPKKVQTLLDPNVLILEGGNVERSRAEYAAHHLPADLKFMQAVTYKLDRQSGDTVGDLAWVVSEARLSGAREGKPIDLVSTETLVLKKSSAGWKVVHIHWSSRPVKKQPA
jgi:mono/diheme cytochrome c family protein